MTDEKGSTTILAKARVVLSKQNLGSLERSLATLTRLEWAANEDCMFRGFSKRFLSHSNSPEGLLEDTLLESN